MVSARVTHAESRRPMDRNPLSSPRMCPRAAFRQSRLPGDACPLHDDACPTIRWAGVLSSITYGRAIASTIFSFFLCGRGSTNTASKTRLRHVAVITAEHINQATQPTRSDLHSLIENTSRLPPEVPDDQSARAMHSAELRPSIVANQTAKA